MDLENLLYKLIHAKEPSEFILEWRRFQHVTKDYKLIVTSENYNKNDIYPEGLANILKLKDTDFLGYFMSEKIFFLDTDIINLMSLHTTVEIKYDYSIMFDTNYTSYIEIFLKKINTSNFSEESIYKTIDALLRYKFNYDYTFYIIENYKNLFSSGEEMFTISNPKHLAVFENLIYLELFKSIDRDEYIKGNKIEYKISENEAKQKADEQIAYFYKTHDKASLKVFVDMHKNITLLLIGIWQVHFSSKASAKNKMKKLFEFVRINIGVYFERELIIAYKYFEETKSVSMLNKINKSGNQIGLLEKIENIAWDFLVPRVMEFQINVNKEKSFFIPFFLTHDKKLKELMSIFGIKGILFHKETNEFIPISSLKTTEFFKEKGLLKDIELLMSKSVKEERAKVRKYNVDTNFEVINTELKKLYEILVPNK